MIISHYPYEPHKLFTAFQAAVILLLAVIPLVWSVSFRTTITHEPLQVTIVSEIPRPITRPPDPISEISEVNEQIQKLQSHQQQEAEIARRRTKQREEELAKERELAAEQKRQQEAQRERELEEQKQREQDELRRREQEAQAKEELERKQQEELQRQQQQLEQQRQAQEQAELARLEAARNDRIKSRYISSIRNRIQRFLADPEGVNPNIRVEILVPLGINGRLSGAPKITASSGNQFFDDQALRAVIRGAEAGFELPTNPELRKQFNELHLVLVPKGN